MKEKDGSGKSAVTTRNKLFALARNLALDLVFTLGTMST
jgi:hypothetical protein